MDTFGGMIKIEFDKGDIAKIIAALTKMQTLLPKLRDEMTYRQSVDYRNMIFANIDKQTFAGTYEPYNPRYKKWKQETMGLGNKYWELFGDLIQNIDIVKSIDPDGIGHAVGVFTNKAVGGKSWNSTPSKTIGKKMSIARYAFDMEFGSKGRFLPARPLFGPTLKQFKKTGAAAYQGNIVNKMKSIWR